MRIGAIGDFIVVTLFESKTLRFLIYRHMKLKKHPMVSYIHFLSKIFFYNKMDLRFFLILCGDMIG